MPTFEEAKVWGILAAQNAQVLLDSARLVAEHGDRGRGISLAVLAVEEAAKARAMFGYARSEHRPGFILDAAMMKKIIRGPHQVRHLIAWLQGSSREARRVTMSETRDPEAEKRHEAELAALDWLLVANTSKNGGLYVDYLGAGHWSTPQAATKEQWEMAEAVAPPFVAEAASQAARWLADPVAGSEKQKGEPPGFPGGVTLARQLTGWVRAMPAASTRRVGLHARSHRRPAQCPRAAQADSTRSSQATTSVPWSRLL